MGMKLGALFALGLIFIFLLFYAFRVASVPLALIIFAVLGMIAVDFVQSFRDSDPQRRI